MKDDKPQNTGPPHPLVEPYFMRKSRYLLSSVCLMKMAHLTKVLVHGGDPKRTWVLESKQACVPFLMKAGDQRRVQRVGDTCQDSCLSLEHGACISSVCACLDGYYDPGDGTCQNRILAGYTCFGTSQTECVSNAQCTAGQCACYPGYINDRGLNPTDFTTATTAAAMTSTTLAAAPTSSDLDIFPSSYLPGVSRNVQLTCRLPVQVDAARVLMLQLSKVESGARTPVASLLTGGSPVAEVQKLNVSVSGHYDNLHPSSSWLRADILDPKEDAEGDYLCIVETVDSHGLLHRYLDTATLTSLNGLNALRNAQTDVTRADNEALAKLSQIDSIYNSIHNGIPVVNKGLSDVAQKEKSMRAELDRLRDITPEVKVSFYAYLSAGGTRPYASVANNNNIVFDRYQQHTDNSYSTSNGIFTCPQNGTYFFRTGVMNSGSTHSYATILADDVEVASVYMYDDYSTKQATASAVVKLVEGERVRVVVRTGSTDRIYGSNSNIPNRVTYFMGLLLW
ncbi:hypothetical protein BaRGS_00005217 [Batillaria attramentaria]|uniref:C1q domain-containing protein n=1 Tax=Batillaria attramentaria TaxID=370345 RepID=A0ABD0LWB7_9CAEN